MSEEEGTLYDGNQVDVWREKFKDSDEQSITVRIGMTTIMMPHSIFLELQKAVNEAHKKMEVELK